MKISVITVCFQAEKTIAETIESVKCQTYHDLEYLIIDGCSKDATVELAKKALDGFGACLISEPDGGIYDAMNKGVGMATGDYIHFLNAGDTYFSEDVIERVVCEIERTGADIVYGDIEYRYPDGKKERRKYDSRCARQIYYLTGDCINHQAMFARRTLFEKELFDTELKICADRDWMMKKSRKGVSFHAMGFPVCAYSYDGASLQQKDVYNREASLCIRRHYPWGYPIFAAFEFMRNHKVLAGMLHAVYKRLFIRDGK